MKTHGDRENGEERKWIFTVDTNLVAKWHKYKSRSTKSFHRSPISIDQVTNRTTLLYHDTRANCKIYVSICNRTPLVSKLPCNAGFYIKIYTTLTAAARAVPDLSSSFPLIFFRSFDRSIHLFSPVSFSVCDSS